MDVKIVLVITVFVLCAIHSGKSGVVFNFRDKLRMANASNNTTERDLLSSQIIRVPDLECPDGFRRDQLGNCRQRL